MHRRGALYARGLRIVGAPASVEDAVEEVVVEMSKARNWPTAAGVVVALVALRERAGTAVESRA